MVEACPLPGILKERPPVIGGRCPLPLPPGGILLVFMMAERCPFSLLSGEKPELTFENRVLGGGKPLPPPANLPVLGGKSFPLPEKPPALGGEKPFPLTGTPPVLGGRKSYHLPEPPPG